MYKDLKFPVLIVHRDIKADTVAGERVGHRPRTGAGRLQHSLHRQLRRGAHRRFHPPRPGLHPGRRRRCRGKPAPAAGCGRTDPRGPRAGAAIADLRPRRAGDHRERAGRVHGRPAPVARHPLPVRRHRAVPRPPGRPGGAQPGRAAAAILPCAGRAHRAVQLFLAYAGPRRRCRLSQESGGTGLPPVLRGEHAAFRPVGLGPRAGLAARPYRPLAEAETVPRAISAPTIPSS